MRKVLRMVAMEWSTILQYRVEMISWIIAEALVPLIAFAIWYNVADNSGVLTHQEVLTYYVLAIFVNVITMSWNGFFLAREILNGDIVKYLVRPISAFWPHVANNFVEKIYKLLIPLPIFLAVLFLYPHLFSQAIYDFSNIIAFLFSLFIAAILSFALDMNFGVIAFWLEDSIQLRRFKEILYGATSGLLIPFAFMPESVRIIVELSPFRYIVALPVEIILGQVKGDALVASISFQLAWLVGSVVMLSLLWSKGRKRYVVPGQ